MGVANGLKAMGDEVVAVDGWPKILPSVPYSLDLANADYNWASVEELDFFESRLSMPWLQTAQGVGAPSESMRATPWNPGIEWTYGKPKAEYLTTQYQE